MRKIIYLLFAVTFMLFCSNAFTQSTTIFIKALDQTGKILDGGSTAPGHIKQIEALSYSQGESACASCTPQISDYSLMMQINTASITAKQILLSGDHLLSVDVVYQRVSDSYVYYKIHMEDVIITSVQESGSSEPPFISMSITAGRIAWQYLPQGSQKTQSGWDVENNIAWTYKF
ncbi:MAG: type VI secretion system tube protein Hcp [Parafilimonas sp.]